jgi:hypothetical protein
MEHSRFLLVLLVLPSSSGAEEVALARLVFQVAVVDMPQNIFQSALDKLLIFQLVKVELPAVAVVVAE